MDGLKARIADLDPSYFALVMATGIVSIAAHLTGMGWASAALLWLNAAFYAGLVALYLARCLWFPGRVAADLFDHNRGVGFFTTVAGTCVLGSQFVLLRGESRSATVLWAVGVALWAALTYAVFTALTVKRHKPPLAEGLHGGWLLAVVAPQSVAVLGTLLAPTYPAGREGILFFALVLWLAGGMLYVWIIALIFYRYAFFPMDAAHLTPPYWINMGAMAITTLVGAGLAENRAYSALLEDLAPFVGGVTLLAWSTATLWIPMLLILGLWRHVYERFPLRYDPAYWGAVFPIGMYAVCTARIAVVFRLPFLLVVPQVFVYVALAAWLLATLGLVRSLLASATGGLASTAGGTIMEGKSGHPGHPELR